MEIVFWGIGAAATNIEKDSAILTANGFGHKMVFNHAGLDVWHAYVLESSVCLE